MQLKRRAEKNCHWMPLHQSGPPFCQESAPVGGSAFTSWSKLGVAFPRKAAANGVMLHRSKWLTGLRERSRNALLEDGWWVSGLCLCQNVDEGCGPPRSTCRRLLLPMLPLHNTSILFLPCWRVHPAKRHLCMVSL